MYDYLCSSRCVILIRPFFSCRNLVTLSRQLSHQRATDDSMSLTGRHCLILCVLLLSQLLLNYVFTWASSSGRGFPSALIWTNSNEHTGTEDSDQCSRGGHFGSGEEQGLYSNKTQSQPRLSVVWRGAGPSSVARLKPHRHPRTLNRRGKQTVSLIK